MRSMLRRATRSGIFASVFSLELGFVLFIIDTQISYTLINGFLMFSMGLLFVPLVILGIAAVKFVGLLLHVARLVANTFFQHFLLPPTHILEAVLDLPRESADQANCKLAQIGFSPSTEVSADPTRLLVIAKINLTPTAAKTSKMRESLAGIAESLGGFYCSSAERLYPLAS